MTDSDKRYGRTFFDLIAEHPKLTFFIFLAILLIAISLIFLRIPFKFGDFEVGNNKSVVHDTIVKTKVETQYLNKTPLVIKEAPQTRPTKEPNKSVSVKTGDTIVTVQNQPANINTGTNNGIIGNDNKVNIGEPQRKLNDQAKQLLIQLINQTFEKNKTIDSTIQVSAMAGNNEAFNFATEILLFLKAQNFKVGNSLGQFQQSPPVKGAQVGTDFSRKHIEIKVGYR